MIYRWVAGTLALIGSAKAVVGLVGAAMHPDVLATANGAGIPRALPLGCALALLAAAAITWRRSISFEALASALALGAAALARPGILAAGWPDWRIEAVGVLPLLVVASLSCSSWYPARSRLALALAPAALAVELVALMIPYPSAAARAADAAAYTIILGAAAVAAWASITTRRLYA